MSDLEPRVKSLEDDVAQLKTDSALMTLSMENLGEKFDTGFLDIKGTMKDQFVSAKEERQLERKALVEQQRLDREDKKWWWGKVFAIMGVLAAGGVTYYNVGGESPAVEESAQP